MKDISATIDSSVKFILGKIGEERPCAGIILGSGLGKLGESIQDAIVISYKEIPGFPVSTIMGHKGNFIIGNLGGKRVIAMQGRFHYYEGYPMEMVTIGVRVMSRLGIRCLFVSNAAGGCNPDYNVGDLVIIRDHINLLPNPLIGPNMESFGARFPDMTCVYDKGLRLQAGTIATQMGLTLAEGVYLGTTGPAYETPAEVRFYRMAGADLIGMSTIPEAIVARHCGIKVFGMSVVTNKSNYSNDSVVLNDGEDVVKQADIAAGLMSELFARMISEL